MRSIFANALLVPVCAVACLIIVLSTPVAATECATPNSALGVERVVEIDTSAGPLFGEYSVYAKEKSFLGPKEVVLTFDDGPMPWITKSILDTLDSFCAKATFFSVGRMAIAYPGTTKDILFRGHTLGTHTWSHPLNLKRLGLEKATDQIERGFAAVALAAGQPIAPFFRFPGLSDSDPMLAHLQSRGIGAFTVDVISNDSYIGDYKRLARYTIDQLEQRNGGIMLFHDIKSATAKALPLILTEMKARGYKVVHMRSKAAFVPLDGYGDELKPLIEKASPDQKATANLMPFFGSPAVLKTLSGTDADVTAIAPTARPRAAASSKAHPLAERERTPNESGEKSKVRVGGWSERSKPDRTAAEPPIQAKPVWSPSLFGY